MKLDTRIYSFSLSEQSNLDKLGGKTITLSFMRNETTSNAIAIKYGYNVEWLSVALIDCYLYNKSLYEVKTGGRYNTKLFSKALSLDLANAETKFLHHLDAGDKPITFITDYQKKTLDRKRLVKAIRSTSNTDFSVEHWHSVLETREKMNLDGFIVFTVSVLPKLLDRVLSTVPTAILEKYS